MNDADSLDLCSGVGGDPLRGKNSVMASILFMIRVAAKKIFLAKVASRGRRVIIFRIRMATSN